jgi:beta-xylosidase
MKWIGDWPVIGVDKDGDGKGEPVLVYRKPNVGQSFSRQTPMESDEFNDGKLGLQWQWMANPKATWAFLNPASGCLRLFSDKWPDSAENLWAAPNVLLQKIPAEEFRATTKMSFQPNERLENEKAGLTMMGFSYANITLKSKKDGVYLVYTVCKDAEKGMKEKETVITKAPASTVYLRVSMSKGAKCQFSYSFDGNNFINVGDEFQAEVGRWIGAKVGLFCTRETQINDSGYADFDWFRVESLQ